MAISGDTAIPVLSFFTGAGFLDIGFQRAGGFRCTWHNEFNPDFARGFEYGMKHLNGSWAAPVIVASVEDLNADVICRQAFDRAEPLQPFGIIGGPPCPDFSVGGKNKGEHGENGRLSQVYVNRILELQPTFFLFENVPGLERTEKHRQFLHRLIEQLSARYVVDKRMLNALEYGIPQDRDRVFLVGFRRDIYPAGSPILDVQEFGWWDWPQSVHAGAKGLPWPRRTPFGQTPEPPGDEIPPELMVATYVGNGEDDPGGLSTLLNQQDQFRAKSGKFTTIAEGDDSGKSFKRLHRYRYSPTAAYGHNEVHLHPFEPRRLSVREAMRIQSVPDEYALPQDLTLTAKFKMVSNGVPVKLAEAMARSIRAYLNIHLR